ncbi:MAG: PepSY-like domain-containing protein [Parabacteroides sp.]|nr:PepSY-like domain-containing protein [Parabacteroides sp.]
MKRVLMLLVCVFSLSTVTMWAGNDKPIQFNELPATARTFVQKHFPQVKVALTKVDSDFFDKDYDVVFVNGDKIEFDKNGNWKEIMCSSNSSVPSTAIPAQIRTYLTQNYPDVSVVKMEQDRKGYEVKLSNARKLEFDKQFRLIDID